LKKLLFGVFVVFFAWTASSAGEPQWAVPIGLEGVPNLHRVSDTVYRSAQPDRKGFKNLAAIGIKTVINLRLLHGDSAKIQGTSLKEIRVKMTWLPEMGELIQVLRILANGRGGPYLVHCQNGADRTGITIALYRMVVQGWNCEDAIREMAYGYGSFPMSGEFSRFLRQVDVEALSKAVNPPSAPETPPDGDGPLIVSAAFARSRIGVLLL
jgi:protein tyrosine/serine phosphatase